MPSVSVHIAILAVGKDAAPTQTISEVASKAGHQVVGRATVHDTQAAIRAQLQRWIDDANVDVVIVSGGMESDNAGAAVKPLVTQTLPGFTDLFRYLAFQEIGASAMLSNAEAAQCGSTFVFVLPASAGAVKAAMEKLILPQLDVNTTPKNLVSSMPRIRNSGTDAIPVAIVKEKTASGQGLTPKMPSPSAGIRAKSHTGANVVRRNDPDDPPTKPIDVAKLEAQIALSESSHTETKQVDLSKLPKLPPGALSDDTDQIDAGKLPSSAKRLESEPIDPPAPPARRKYQRTEPAGSQTVRPPAPPQVKKPPTNPPPPPQARKAPTDPPPVPPRKPPTDPPPVPVRATAKPPTNPPPPPAAARRAPTNPPAVPAADPPPAPTPRRPTNPPPDIGALVEAPLRRTGDLPAGTFQYPIKTSRGPSKVLWVLVGLILLGVGFAAMVFLFPKDKAGDTAPAAKEPEVVAATTADAAVEMIAADASVLEVEPIDPEPAPTTTTASKTKTPTTAANTAPRPPRGGTQTARPTGPAATTATTTPVAAASGSAQEPEDTVENAPNNPQPTAGDCDEVSCVLAKYDRPCCEKFRPKESGMAQRTAGGLPAELDKSMVRAGIEKVKPRVVACGEKSTDKGMVKVAVNVRPDGSVSAANIVASPSASLGDCVAAAMKKAEFAKSVGGGTFTYPFSF